jgi:DNA polymerase elongation subunit (family B)
MDKLVNGKAGLQRIVSLEVKDETTEIFIQADNGTVSSKFMPNSFWVLANRPLNSGFTKLNGNLHYKYGTLFKERKEYEKFRQIWRRQNKDTYSVYNAKEACMIKDGYTYYQGLQPNEVSVLSFDIETTGLSPEAQDAFVIIISTTYRDSFGKIEKRLFSYDDFDSQGKMLDDFCTYVRLVNPSILLGHNIIQFDLKYLNVIAEKNDTKLLLGRDNSALYFNSYDSKFRVDGNRDLEYKNCYVYGREIIDTYFIAQKFDVVRAFTSYGLKSLVKELGLEDPHRTFYEAGEIRNNYKNPVEYEKIKAYCKDDSDDSLKIWDKMGAVFFHLAPIIPKAFQDIILSASGSQINALMVRAYLQDKHSIPKADEAKKFEGAISFAVPGIYNNCFKIDLAQLYPSIMVEYNVYDDEKDPNGYLLQLVKSFREKRLYYKKLAKDTGEKIYSDMDSCYKGVVNSFYGFCGAPGLQFNSLACAEFITAQGREILLYTIKWASGMPEDLISTMLGNDEETEE